MRVQTCSNGSAGLQDQQAWAVMGLAELASGSCFLCITLLVCPLHTTACNSVGSCHGVGASPEGIVTHTCTQTSS